MFDQLALLGSGLLNTFEPLNFAMIVTGLVIGVLAGALPGITMLNAIVLVLPFTYLMGIVPSLLLMTSVYCGGVFGGSITGILFNIPGDPMNVPTTWEGYQLNKKGFVSKALGMAIMCSAIGGFLSAVIMTVASPLFAEVALSFSTCEYFAVVFLGLASVVVIGTRSVSSAFISLFIGMLLGTVGMDDIYGAARFTFGSRIMETGINFTTVLIGIFAIGEVLDQLSVKDKQEIVGRLRPKTTLPSLKDLWDLAIRSCAVWASGWLLERFPAPGPPWPPSSLTAWKSRSRNIRKNSAPASGKAWPPPKHRSTAPPAAP
jgi:putative tricarboxylic transport membrane protein